jgi:hypothetical protein
LQGRGEEEWGGVEKTGRGVCLQPRAQEVRKEGGRAMKPLTKTLKLRKKRSQTKGGPGPQAV